MGQLKKIGVLRALQLGDLMCMVPAMRALRAAYPEARIVLFGLPGAKEFVTRFSRYFDGLLEFPGYPGLPEQPVDPVKVAEFLRQVQNEKFDLVLQLQGNGTIINPLMGLLGAKQVAGFFSEKDGYCPDPRTFLLYPEGEHESIKFLKLMDFLGVARQGEYLEFPVKDEEREKFGRLRKKFALTPGRFICLNPGARDPRRQWISRNFAVVGEAFAKRGFGVVLTGSPQDRPVCEAVAKQMIHPCIDLAGLTGLGELAALLESSALLITNDTGISHIAVALKVKSIVIFSAFSDPVRWAPLDQGVHISLSPKEAEDPDMVVKAASVLMEKSVAVPKLIKTERFTTPIDLSASDLNNQAARVGES